MNFYTTEQDDTVLRRTLASIIFLIMLLFLNACGVNDDYERYSSSNRSTEIGVSLENIPDTKNDLNELIKASNKVSTSKILGRWKGVYEYYLNNEYLPYNIDFEISLIDNELNIFPKGSRANMEKYTEVKFDGRLLTFIFEGHLSKPDGTLIPIKASLVAHENSLKGIYQQYLDEYGGIEYFANYDANLALVSE